MSLPDVDRGEGNAIAVPSIQLVDGSQVCPNGGHMYEPKTSATGLSPWDRDSPTVSCTQPIGRSAKSVPISPTGRARRAPRAQAPRRDLEYVHRSRCARDEVPQLTMLPMSLVHAEYRPLRASGSREKRHRPIKLAPSHFSSKAGSRSFPAGPRRRGRQRSSPPIVVRHLHQRPGGRSPKPPGCGPRDRGAASGVARLGGDPSTGLAAPRPRRPRPQR